MTTLTITARKITVGHGPMYQLRDNHDRQVIDKGYVYTTRAAALYQLRDNHDRQVVDEGYLYDTRAKALLAVESLYPSNSVWAGKRTRRGWQITID